MPGCVGQVTDVCGAIRHAGRSRSIPAGHPGRRMIEHDCNPAAQQTSYPVGEEHDPDPPALEQGARGDLICQPYPAERDGGAATVRAWLVDLRVGYRLCVATDPLSAGG